MKFKILKNLIYILAFFLRSRMFQHLNDNYKRLKNLVCSLYHGVRFESCDLKNIFIEYPTTLIRGHEYINIGENFFSRKGLRLETIWFYNDKVYNPKIQIGNNVSLNNDCHIACIDKIVIGDNVLFASKIFITDHFHGEINGNELTILPASRNLYSKGPVVIEDSVWIGECVAIMPGVTIGKNSIIGANSVVTKSFEANSIIAGNPARLIKRIHD